MGAASTVVDGQACFAHQLETYGGAPAIITEQGETLSYRGLAERADAWASRFASATLVMIEAANEPDPLCAYLGALRAGKPVILAPAAANQRLVEMYHPDARVARGRDGNWDVTFESRADPRPHPDLAVLLCTSGTTGATKLVRLSTQAIQANAASIAEYLAIAPSDRAMASLPFHYSYGLSVVNSHLLAGASLVLTEHSVVDPEFWHLFERHRATSLAGVPHTYNLLERVCFREKALPSLRTLTQAGGRLEPSLVAAYAEWAKARGVKFFVMYGQTEATARMAYLPPELAGSAPGAIGVPIPGGAFRIVDADGRPVIEADAVGELVYTGPNVMMGYALTAADLARGPELKELRTGDLAARDAAGHYRIVGRMSRFAKIYGLRISLDEVESQLSRMGAAGVAVSDDKAIYIALTGSTPPAAVARALALDYKLPDMVFRVHKREPLPTLPSGKIDYQAILKEGQARLQTEDIGAAVDNPIEAAFIRLFPRSIIRPQDSFVSLGGDSLNYVALSLELERALGYLPVGWERLSLAELCGVAVRSKPRRWWDPRALEAEVLLRALAVLAVVANHVSDLAVGGGAEVLLMLAGYNLARYQKTRLSSGKAFDFTLSFARRIILPYYILLLGFLALKREFDLSSLLLVSNFFGRFGSMIEPFWFLEAILQCLIVISLLCMFRPVREAVGAAPWRLGVAFLALAIGVKATASAAFHHGALMSRTPDAVLYLMAIGWCAHEARSVGRRLGLTLVIGALAAGGLIGIPGIWPAWPGATGLSHSLWMAGSTVALLWVRRLWLPSILHVGASSVAAASFYIYLTHVVPVFLVFWWLGVRSLPLNLAVAIAVGIAAWWIAERAARWRSVHKAAPAFQ